MNNTKCNLFVVGQTGVGITFLISSLREFNYSRIETVSVFTKTDWVINTRYGQIEVEIKEKQRLDKAAIELIEKSKNQKSFILFVTHLHQHTERSFSFDEDLRLLKRLSDKATVMVAFVARYKEAPSDLVLSQLRKELPFVEFIFPISSVSHNYESIYEFSFALKQIITSSIPNQLALARELIQRNFDLKEKILDLGNCNITSLYQIKDLFRNTHLETLILSNEWGEYSRGKYIRRVSDNEDSPNILFGLPKEISKLKLLKVLICGGNWRGKRSSKTPVKWHIADISVLTTLSNLTVINASNNDIDTIGEIGKLENLNKLYLNNNNIRHVPDIGNLKKLKEIYLSNNKLSKVDFLEKLSDIKTIDLHSNRIQDLSPLKTLISKLNIKDSKWEVNSISVYRNPLNVHLREKKQS